MESTLGRVGLWFGLLIVAVLAVAAAKDTGFAIHMAICLLYTSPSPRD